MLVAIPAVLSALLHVYIFVIESFRITAPSTMRTFGIRSREEAQIMRPWAYNQGWYNFFLAAQTLIGVLLLGSHHTVGLTLIVAGTASMAAAALVLITSDRSKARAAIVQGLFPVLTLIAILTTR